MNNQKAMHWIDALPNVQGTEYLERRDHIGAKLTEAAELQRKATELMKEAEQVKGSAYFAALTLEGSIQGRWSKEEIEQAKQKVGW